MLTSFQASPGAYADTSGLLFCPTCASKRQEGVETRDYHGMFLHLYNIPDVDVTGLEPVIGYTLDEMQSAEAEDAEWPDDYDHSECEPALIASGCGHELREEYHYGHPHDVQNVPAPRWVPCSQCGAGDGERHKANCPQLVRDDA